MWIMNPAGRRLIWHLIATLALLVLLVLAGTILAPSAVADTDTIVFQTASGGAIYAVNPDGSNLRFLTTGIDPALSPDGQQVAFTRWDDTQHGAFGSLWLINVDGSGERAILGDVRQPKSPVWSPDGGHIAINMQQGGRLSPEAKCGDGLPSEPLLADRDGDYFRVKVEVDSDGQIDTQLCYTLTTNVNPAGKGAVERLPAPNCDTNKYLSGTEVQLTAVPNAGYLFKNWSGNATGTVNPTTVKMNDMDIQRMKHSLGCLQCGYGVMVSSGNDNLPAAGPGGAYQEVVVHFEGIIRRGARIKNISGHDQNIGLPAFQLIHKPIQEELVLLPTVREHQCLAQVPVCGVENSHWGDLMVVSDKAHVPT